jgi:drug/metabolite transporter (DMT)-like permease
MRAVTVPEVSVLGQRPSRLAASVQAVLVVFVWATSWILIKGKLHDIAALSFAGLRYGLAFVCLLALLLGRPALRSSVVALPRRSWLRLGTLGLLLYGLTQATVFLGLYRLPAVTLSLLLSLTPALVTVLAIPLLGEVPTPVQGGGVLLSLAGTLVYFGPVALPAGQLVAIGVVAVGVIAFAAATMLGRSVNRDDGLPALTVTVVSMGIGSGLLLAVAVVHDGIPRLTPSSWLVVLWLAVINTALAFTVWNHTMRRLSAMESSLINNTMLVHVAVLAWIFLGERPNARAMLGLVLVAGGVVLVQRRRVGKRQATPQAHQQSGGQGDEVDYPVLFGTTQATWGPIDLRFELLSGRDRP